MKLYTGTVPLNNSLYTGTIPVNNSLCTGTILMNNSLCTGADIVLGGNYPILGGGDVPKFRVYFFK